MQMDTPVDVTKLISLTLGELKYVVGSGPLKAIEDYYEAKLALAHQDEVTLIGLKTCNFGKKHKGKRWCEVLEQDPQYIAWILKTNKDCEPQFKSFYDKLAAYAAQ